MLLTIYFVDADTTGFSRSMIGIGFGAYAGLSSVDVDNTIVQRDHQWYIDWQNMRLGL